MVGVEDIIDFCAAVFVSQFSSEIFHELLNNKVIEGEWDFY